MRKASSKTTAGISSSFVTTQDLFSQYQLEDKGGYISQEFQDFGYRLAVTLNDLPHKSLYMKLAKNENRALLEQALSFVSDSNAKSKARLFMWKLKELKKNSGETKQDKNQQKPGREQ